MEKVTILFIGIAMGARIIGNVMNPVSSKSVGGSGGAPGPRYTIPCPPKPEKNKAKRCDRWKGN